MHWGIIFMLTPLVLVLPMFFTTLRIHYLSNCNTIQTGYFACRGTIYRYAWQQSIIVSLTLIDWCKSCDKVRYRNNGFLQLVCVCGTNAAGPCGQRTRPARANSVSYVIVTNF